jgi:hypothetical protein
VCIGRSRNRAGCKVIAATGCSDLCVLCVLASAGVCRIAHCAEGGCGAPCMEGAKEKNGGVGTS